MEVFMEDEEVWEGDDEDEWDDEWNDDDEEE